MAKVQTIATLSPEQFMAEYGVFVEDARAVCEFLNWVACQRNQVHVATAVGPDGWSGDADTPAVHAVEFATTSSWYERFRFAIVVHPEQQVIQFGFRCFFTASGQGGQIRVTIGAATPVVLSVAFADNGNEVTGTVLTSASGTGDLEVIVEINHTTGTGAGNYVRSMRFEDAIQTVTALPDPLDT